MTTTLDRTTERPVPVSSLDEGSSARERWWSMPRLAVVGALIVVGAVHVCNVNGWPIAIDDEGTYVAQAWALYHGKLAHYTYWYDHPPIGWIQLATWLGIPVFFGAGPTLEVARYVMVGYTLVSAYLIYRLCRNLGTTRVAAVAGLLAWGLCPLAISQGRQVLLDNIALPWLLGAFVLVTSRRRALWHHVAAGLCFGVGVLTKETNLVLAPALLVSLWICAYRPTRAFSVIGASTMTVLVCAVYPLFAMLRTELLAGTGHVSIQDAVAFQLLDRPGSGSVLQADSNVRGLMTGWFADDRFLVLAGVACAIPCLGIRRARGISIGLLILVAMAMRPGGYVPAMYVITVLPLAAVALVVALDHSICRVTEPLHGRRQLRVLATVGLLVVAVMVAGPRWGAGIRDATTSDLNQSRAQAIDWMVTHLDHRSRILVDDSYWDNFVNAGWSGDGWSGPIWYYKLDLDPDARRKNLPGSWQQVDYIVMSRTVRDTENSENPPPLVTAAYQHSTVVRTWGRGVDSVELRAVIPGSAIQGAGQ